MGLVRIPILFDDFALYRDRLPYHEWERRALGIIAATDFVAFGLHDCYAQFWLPYYDRLLERVASLGEIETLDQVSDDVILRSCV